MIGAAAPVRPELDPGQADSRRVREAAEQFEAVLLGQFLKSVRESEADGWLGAGEDAAGGSMMDVAEEHFAAVMAAGGGIGIAALVQQGLRRE